MFFIYCKMWLIYRFWRSGPIFYTTFLQVSKSIVNMMFYALFIPCLFCANISVSLSFINSSFKINDSFKSSIFVFFLSSNTLSISIWSLSEVSEFCNFGKRNFWLSYLNEFPELLCGLNCDHSWSQTIPMGNSHWAKRILQSITISLRPAIL